MNKLTFVPAGGLANRMRATAAAYTLASRVGSPMSAVWFCDWALNAPFHALFEPVKGASEHDALEQTGNEEVLAARAVEHHTVSPGGIA